MKKIIGVLGVLGLALLLAPTPASAFCGSSVVFGNQANEGTCGGGYCYVTSPGANTLATLKSTFWALGGGSPTLGVGDDNGSTDTSAFLTNFGFGGGYTISGDWSANATTDGCINNEGTTGKMVMQFSDTDAAGATAYAAVACVTRNTTVSIQFDYAKVNQNIALQPLAKPSIVSTARAGNESQITVAPPSFASMYYSDGSAGCAIGTVIPSYDVYLNTVGRNAAAPTSRSTGWTLAGTCAITGNCTVTTACGTTNCDAYVAVAPHYDSGFSTGTSNTAVRVSANSTRVQAGPTLANPPDFKIIKKSPQDRIPTIKGNQNQ